MNRQPNFNQKDTIFQHKGHIFKVSHNGWFSKEQQYSIDILKPWRFSGSNSTDFVWDSACFSRFPSVFAAIEFIKNF